MQEGMEGNPAAATMKNVMRGLAIATVPLTMNFPKVFGIFRCIPHAFYRKIAFASLLLG